MGHILTIDVNATLGDGLEPRNAVHKSRLATAGRADQNQEFAGLDIDINAFQGFLSGITVGLADTLEL